MSIQLWIVVGWLFVAFRSMCFAIFSNSFVFFFPSCDHLLQILVVSARCVLFFFHFTSCFSSNWYTAACVYVDETCEVTISIDINYMSKMVDKWQLSDSKHSRFWSYHYCLILIVLFLFSKVSFDSWWEGFNQDHALGFGWKTCIH